MQPSLASRVSALRLGPVARRVAGLSGMTAMGQVTFVLALPLLSRLYSPADFGVFTVYLSIVNICGPIAALKFDSALYGTPSRDAARPILALALFSIFLLSLAAWALWTLTGARLPGTLEPWSAPLALLTPIGVVLAGLWATTSAWAVRCGAISTLSGARFLQPAAMTAMQLAAGLSGRSAMALIVAHLVSHALYSGPSPSRMFRLAWANRLFPLYVMPANVVTQLVANAPPIVLGALFGAEVAGYCGMAYRLAFAPVAIVSLSLGHVFTAEICRGASRRAVEGLASKIVLGSLTVVGLPILIFGALAPFFSGLLLGSNWSQTGSITFAYAVFGAAQAMATPFAETSSLYHLQSLRFSVEARTAAMVFAAIFLGFWLRWDALATIWLMSAAGAAGTLAGLASVWRAFKTRLGQAEFPPGEAGTPATTS
jgi:O-antigen/teichoic acid export membrane protein